MEQAHKELLEEVEEQKTVINDLIDQITQKTIEIVEFKKQADEAYKTAAEAKTSLAQCKFEKEQLETIIEQLRKKVFTD